MNLFLRIIAYREEAEEAVPPHRLKSVATQLQTKALGLLLARFFGCKHPTLPSVAGECKIEKKRFYIRSPPLLLIVSGRQQDQPGCGGGDRGTEAEVRHRFTIPRDSAIFQNPGSCIDHLTSPHKHKPYVQQWHGQGHPAQQQQSWREMLRAALWTSLTQEKQFHHCHYRYRILPPTSALEQQPSISRIPIFSPVCPTVDKATPHQLPTNKHSQPTQHAPAPCHDIGKSHPTLSPTQPLIHCNPGNAVWKNHFAVSLWAAPVSSTLTHWGIRCWVWSCPQKQTPPRSSGVTYT